MADDFEIPDESEQLDQLQSEDTLVDRGVDDVLDEGYTAPEKWSVAQGFGNTAAEQAAGESFEQRLAQEEPDPEIGAPIPRWNPDGEEREVGSRRAGRLVDLHGIVTDGAQIGAEVGIDGGAAPAEEAAVHIIDPAQPDDDEDADGADGADGFAAGGSASAGDAR